MPELPEVETVRKTLEQLVTSKTIADVTIYWPKIIKQPQDSEEFRHRLTGQTIETIDRRGKYLLFYLTDYVLISHLRMEGKYGIYPKDEPFDKHTHVIFHFTDDTELRYRDVRKFGTMHLVFKGEEFAQAPLAGLGIEPFDKQFTVEYLEEAFCKTMRNIKVVLLDQTIVTGLGNIYVDEALFRANIHPLRAANSLSREELSRLKDAIVETLTEAVEKGGTTIRSYVNSQGEIGMFQLELNVYGREGEPCKRCGSIIEKMKVGGRGTHICPKCQKTK